MTKPWERQPKETAVAYAAFEKYRAMGKNRSIAKVARECSKNISLLNRWSQKHGWVARVRAFDAQGEHERLDDEEEARQDMRDRHKAFSHRMQELAGKKLKTMTEDMLDRPRDIKEWLQFAFEIERECLGLPPRGSPLIQVNQNTSLSVNITEENVLMVTRLYPMAYNMLNDKQKAELDEARKQLEALNQ